MTLSERLYCILILTIVLGPMAIYGKPHVHAPIDPNSSKEKLKETDKSLNELGLNVTLPTSVSPVEKGVEYYPYLQSMSPQLGTLINIKDTSELLWRIGIQFMFPSNKPQQWEGSFHINSNSDGALSFSRRFINNHRGYFRPYYKAGVFHRVKSKDQLASIFKFERYALLLAFGLEDLFEPPLSTRIEGELILSDTIQAFVLNLGYSWAW